MYCCENNIVQAKDNNANGGIDEWFIYYGISMCHMKASIFEKVI
jgi:hypothetical protein